MRRTHRKILFAVLAALLLAAGCGSESEDETAAVQYKVLGGRLVWCSGGAEEMAVPGSASSIGNNAFSNCGTIGTLTIPASVTHIMRHTFSGVRVGKIIFGGTVAEWVDMADQDGFGESLDGTPVICSDGEWRWIRPAVPEQPAEPDDPWEIEDGVFVRYTGSATNETIPSNVTAIAGGAFEGHTELERVVIPAGVTAIAPGAFAGSGITEIEYKGTTAEWDALVEAGGIADELDGITVKCSDGTWTPAHIHAWGETYTNGGEGGHYKTCTECDGHSATEEHTWGGTPQADGDGGHYLTCTAAGCGARSETVAHEYEYSDGGDTHTMTCADCNHTKSEEHAYSGETYTDAGHTKTCARCGHTETTPHVWSDTYTSGDNGHYKTCTAAGCNAHSATVEHTWGGETHTSAGGHYQLCTAAGCGARSGFDQHTYGGTPLADGDGGHYQSCTLAGCEARSETEPHNYAYADGGSTTHTMSCADCNYTKSEEHEYSGETYTDAGHTKTCTGCGHTETAQHAWGETYTSGGTDGHYKTCTTADCGAHSETEAHTYGATYTDNGSGKHYQTCSVCHGQSTAVAHTYDGYTDDENGKHYQTCAVCGGMSDPVSHDYEYKDSADGTHTITCTKCEYSKTEEHRYKDGTCLDCKCPHIIYLNSSSGDDANSGLTASKAVKTLSKAIELFESQGAQKIMVCAAYRLPSDESTLLDRAGKEHLTLVRYDGSSDVSGSFTKYLLTISQGDVTITNVTLDGNKENVSATGTLLSISGSTTVVTLGDGATVCNNKKVGYGGGVYISDGSLTMDGGAVTGNEASNGYSAGGVCVSSGTFTMKHGTISGNTTTANGGGVYVNKGTFTMSGGEISGNNAGCGGGVYVEEYGSFTQTSGTVSGNSPDDVYP
ncbi:MAG: leucine-rich repeat domain-containing protein [Treponemataceae bacterium]|nr:leucine-rich repeat domain-containing protein [Treponemataceae bacterium]